ncbi:hypothetical protein [Levilactobacillus tongjiangensis]|uniref:Uncharacterized protein n=1 Tax=Levilactobacillus tongjiangensis TaxID=2486023 RepID=A0ABW1SNU7_9LACO|nr:hypothetical protein [Levilactobacillus tongjiangensis]
MTEIKVIGDILSGKFQPSLTGNQIVDAALIDHFCQNLAIALQLSSDTIQAEHHWDLTINPNVVYIIDTQILRVSGHQRGNGNVIPVSHTDLLRGQITATKQQLISQDSLHYSVN